MDVIFAPFEWRTALVYLKDIVILSKTPKEHIVHVKQVRTFLQKVEVILKLKKSHVFIDTIDYPGLLIRLRRFEIALRTTDAINQ